MAGKGSKGQKVMRPGKASTFANFDSRTATPTKGGKGNLQHGKGPAGVLGKATGTGFVKGGGNPTGGSGGKAC